MDSYRFYFYDKYIFFSSHLYNFNWEKLEPAGTQTHISHKPSLQESPDCKRYWYKSHMVPIFSVKIVQMRGEKYIYHKNKYLLRCIKVPFFREVIFREGVQQESKNLQALTNMSPSLTKENSILFRYNNYFRKILTINCTGVWTIKKTDITKVWIDMEWHIQKFIWQGRMQPLYYTMKSNNYIWKLMHQV